MPILEVARSIVTHRFFRNHVVLIDRDDLSRRELDEIVRNQIERKYQDRMADNESRQNPIEINSVIVLSPRSLSRLRVEVLERQQQFAAAPNANYLSGAEYLHYERGTRGPAPSSKKRASCLGERVFAYGVAPVTGEHGPAYKINHHGGVQ